MVNLSIVPMEDEAQVFVCWKTNSSPKNTLVGKSCRLLAVAVTDHALPIIRYSCASIFKNIAFSCVETSEKGSARLKLA